MTLDLSGTAEASITDLSPRDEISEHPVKISTTYTGGLKFDIAMLPVHPELSAEHSTEQDVYFPQDLRVRRRLRLRDVGFHSNRR